MNKAMEKTLRKSLHIPEGELLTIWRLPGRRCCPLGNPETDVTNCPMGFDTGKWSSNNPPAWMRERLSAQILAQCQGCQGKHHPTSGEVKVSGKVYEILIGGDNQ